MKDHVWKIIGVVAVLAVGASIVYSNSVSSRANDGVVFEAHIKGNTDAKVVLTEHSDFQCPACGQFFPVIQDLLAEHGDSIAFEYKHFPLISIHPYAVPAAKAAEAAGQQGKFFEMHDKLFENQQIWSVGAAPQAFFNAYAEELGLDVGLFKTHMKSSLINDKIQAEFEEARELGLTSTPSFFLNGKRMSFQTYEDFVGQITAAVNPEAADAEMEADHATEPAVRFGL